MHQEAVAAIELVELEKVRVIPLPVAGFEVRAEAPQPLLHAFRVHLRKGRDPGPDVRIEMGG
jgi:hypothetical protein